MLPLHIAVADQASEAVVAALLAAHPGAAKERDKVLPPLLHTYTFCADALRAYTGSPARLRDVQGGRLPLHVAAQFKASEGVVAALLVAHPGAAAEEDFVRPPRSHPLCAAKYRLRAYANSLARLSALRRVGSCPCIMLRVAMRRRR